MQFVQQESQALKKELGQLTQDLEAQRDLVAKTKHERDDYRAENAKLRQHAGVVNSDDLTKDFEARKKTMSQLEDEIAALKARHEQMMKFVKSHVKN